MKSAYDAIMEHIEVTPEIRRRALDRIAREDLTPVRAERAGVPALKRYLSAAACLVLLLAGAAVLPGLLDRDEPEPPPVLAVPNITEAASLQELSALVGFEVDQDISLPFEAEETTYCSYWNQLAEVTYSGGGHSAVYRQSAGQEDNSGDYNVYSDVTEMAAGGRTVTLKGEGGLYRLAVWTDGTYAYSLRLSQGAAKETWRTIL